MKSVSKIVILGFALSIVGCASLHERVYDNVHVGDSADHVVDVLGKPDRFGASSRIPGATAWYYLKRSDICGLTIQENIVKFIGCDNNPNYRNPAAAFAKGFSDGYNNGRANQVNCTTFTNGSTAQTTCR